MKSQFKILDWLVEIDREATSKANQELTSGAESCGCLPCKTFVRFRDQILPQELLEVLASCGCDSKKDIEVYDIDDDPDKGKVSFYGWYHACGRILEGAVTSKPSLNQARELKYLHLARNCKILIEEETALAKVDFPRPIIQINFIVEVDKSRLKTPV